MLFKWFPDTQIAWRDVLPGAVATALLFNVGKFAIGWYTGTQGLESTYGAAASVVEAGPPDRMIAFGAKARIASASMVHGRISE